MSRRLRPAPLRYEDTHARLFLKGDHRSLRAALIGKSPWAAARLVLRVSHALPLSHQPELRNAIEAWAAAVQS